MTNARTQSRNVSAEHSLSASFSPFDGLSNDHALTHLVGTIYSGDLDKISNSASESINNLLTDVAHTLMVLHDIPDGFDARRLSDKESERGVLRLMAGIVSLCAQCTADVSTAEWLKRTGGRYERE